MIKVNNRVIKYDRFPDNTLNIKGDGTLRNTNVVITWNYEDDSEFMVLAFLTKSYQAYGNKVTLFMPYVPNARMDRVENKEDIFTMKYFGELINSLNFDSVYVMDTHSSVAIASINRCNYIKPDILRKIALNEIYERTGRYPLMFFPDEGAMKRYSKDLKGIPYGFGIKNRDWRTGKILGLEVMGLTSEIIRGRDILIQDDICSKGGTFYYAAKKLKEMGAADIYLLVTHCENSIHKGELGENGVNLLATGLIKHVFTTDSIYNCSKSDLITVVHLAANFDKKDTCCDCSKKVAKECATMADNSAKSAAQSVTEAKASTSKG